MTIFVLILLASLTSLVIIVPERVHANPGFYDDWLYYKQISLSNSNNSYQMLINVTKTLGGDVNCSGRCLDTFADVRFVNVANTTKCDYWIEEYVSGSWARFWVELPSDVESNNAINMYYGNSTAVSESDGVATFLYFDNWKQDNTSDWNRSAPGYIAYSLNLSNVSLTSDDIGPNRRFYWKANISDWDTAPTGAILWFAPGNDVDNNYPQQDGIGWTVSTDSDKAGISDTEYGFKATFKKDGASTGDYFGGVPYPACNGFHIYELLATTTTINVIMWNTFTVPYLSTWANGTIPTNSELTNITVLLGSINDDDIFEHRGGDYLYAKADRNADNSEVGTYIDYWFYSYYNSVEPTVSSVSNEKYQHGVDHPPINSVPYPANADMDIPLSFNHFNITISDPNGDGMNITWLTNDSGSWKIMQTNSSTPGGLPNGTYYCLNTSWIDTENTKYWWRVITNDSQSEDNDTYYFTSHFNKVPVISNVYPTNNSWGSSGFVPTLHIDVSDADSDLINITWTWYNGGSWHTFGENLSIASGGTYYQDFDNATDYNRKYNWNISVNDGYGNWVNKSYYFTADVFFRKDISNPITTSGAANPKCNGPDPVYNAENDTWHLFYTLNNGGNRDIYRIDMDSPDMNGTATYPGTAVLTLGYTFFQCSVLKHIENSTAVYEDGKYWIYFADSVTQDIYYASSDYLDASTDKWSIHGTPILNCTGQEWHFNQVGVLGLSVRKDINGNYLMMYQGRNNTYPHGLPCYSQIGYASASTKTDWTDYVDNPVFTPSHVNLTPRPWDDDYFDYSSFQRHNNTYVLFYSGQYYDYDECSWSNEELGYATSTDMQTWTKYEWNYIVNTTAGTWDEDGLSDVNLAFNLTSGTAYVFYEGEDTSEGTYDLGRAWSDDFWDKFDFKISNPVILSNPVPENGSWMNTDNITEQFNITVNDTDGDSMNISWWTNASGTWTQFNETLNVGNGTYNATNLSWIDDCNVTYYWSVNVTDGTAWNNSTFHFDVECKVTQLHIESTRHITDVVEIADAVNSVVGVILIIFAIMGIIAVVSKFGQ